MGLKNKVCFQCQFGAAKKQFWYWNDKRVQWEECMGAYRRSRGSQGRGSTFTDFRSWMHSKGIGEGRRMEVDESRKSWYDLWLIFKPRCMCQEPWNRLKGSSPRTVTSLAHSCPVQVWPWLPATPALLSQSDCLQAVQISKTPWPHPFSSQFSLIRKSLFFLVTWTSERNAVSRFVCFFLCVTICNIPPIYLVWTYISIYYLFKILTVSLRGWPDFSLQSWGTCKPRKVQYLAPRS